MPTEIDYERLFVDAVTAARLDLVRRAKDAEKVSLPSKLSPKNAERTKLVGEIAEIPLTQGKVAIIDAADLSLVSGHKWCVLKARHTFYAISRTSGQMVYMHRVITGATDKTEVDHENRNGLDNRRGNLRVCTRRQNACNQTLKENKTSTFRGVYAKGEKWCAQISANRRVHHIGYFEHETDAAKAYDAKAKELHGEFAQVNFP